MNVYIQLTSAGTNTDYFNLYSDVDGYITPFEQNISRIKLLNGFTSVLVPTDTTVIKIQSSGDCASYVFISVTPTTTTTSTSTTTTTSSTTTTTTSSTTTTTTTTLPPTTTTTTTTTGLPVQTMLIARSLDGTTHVSVTLMCGVDYNDVSIVDLDTVQVVYFASSSSVPVMSNNLYIDSGLTIPFTLSDGTWWGAVTNWNTNTVYDYNIIISSLGQVTSSIPCSEITTTTTTTSSTTTTTTTAIPQYHVEMCVNDTVYNVLTEQSIPYILSPVLINTPTKLGYNFLFFSFPIANSFNIKDSLGADVTSDFALDTSSGTGGYDIRPGYYNNYIFRSSSVYATSFSLGFTITLS